MVGRDHGRNFPIAVPSWKLIPAIFVRQHRGLEALRRRAWHRYAASWICFVARACRTASELVPAAAPARPANSWIEAVDKGLLDKISFTGSTAVGRRIGEVCGRALQIPSLELGGKNPLVILADADLDLAIEGAVWASFGTAGQRCTSAGNIIADKSVMPVVRTELARRAQALVLGDAMDERADYGPLINERFLERWILQRATGIDDGAELLLDGKRVLPGEEPAGFLGDSTRGVYVTPRIFDKVKMTMRVAQEECFGHRDLVEVDGPEEALNAPTARPTTIQRRLHARRAPDAALQRGASRRHTSITTRPRAPKRTCRSAATAGPATAARKRHLGARLVHAWQAVNVDLSGAYKSPIDLPDAARMSRWRRRLGALNSALRGLARAASACLSRTLCRPRFRQRG